MLCFEARRALLIHENSKMSMLTMDVKVITPSLFYSVKMYLISFIRAGSQVGDSIAFSDKTKFQAFLDVLNANYSKSVSLTPVFEKDCIA